MITPTRPDPPPIRALMNGSLILSLSIKLGAASPAFPLQGRRGKQYYDQQRIEKKQCKGRKRGEDNQRNANQTTSRGTGYKKR